MPRDRDSLQRFREAVDEAIKHSNDETPQRDDKHDRMGSDQGTRVRRTRGDRN